MPDPLFDDLYRETEQLRWAPADQVRRRGARLARRRAVTALAAASVLVLSGGVGAYNALADEGPEAPNLVATAPTGKVPSPPPATPTETPTPGGGRNTGDPLPPGGAGGPGTAIPGAAFLQAPDLPSGYQLDKRGHGGDWTVQALSTVCGNQWAAAGISETASAERYFSTGREHLQQRIERYAGTDAHRYVPVLRSNLQGCREYEVTVRDVRLPGDEALVVGTADNSGWLVLRRGDLVTQVAVDDITDPAALGELAGRAADRLCAGTASC
ncbi:hypothetical protein [Plantactinospora sonchi]|uniref:PknH-like extracellular domain-containing protein n=1 Tax=Plantactinospora sonchi TaxID=1544735 RepID=A0ABU7RPD1_9ACTN